MKHLLTVLRFGWPFLKKHKGRLLASLAVGAVLGLSNASFIWVTQTLFERINPPQKTKLEEVSKGRVGIALPDTGWSEFIQDAKRGVNATLDPWLPRAERPMDARQVIGCLLLLPVLVGVRGYASFLATYLTQWVSERVIAELRVSVFEKLNSLSLDFFNRSTMGDLVTRINGDASMLHRCMALGFGDLAKEPLSILFLVTGLCLVSWKLTLLALVFLPLCIIPIAILGRKVRKAAKDATSATINQSGLLIESLSAIRVVKAFGLEREQAHRFQQFTRDITHYNMKSVQARELVNPIIETIGMVGIGLLVIFVFYTATTVPELGGFMAGVALMFTPLKKLASIPVLFAQTSVGVERLRQLFEEQPSVREAVQPAPMKEFSRAIEFAGVSFTYGHQPVLRGVTLSVPRGSRLGIVGESGSGKSTMVNLLFRFYDPTGGALKIDGTDIRELSTADLRARMALVSQEVVVFDATVAENIACGRAGATRAEIEQAARMAYAHDFIMQMPQGYDTRVGERGVLLSGGQRQRLAIARAFVRNAPILVLDEATASLDSQAEAEVQAAIERLEENRTVICVAHRLSTLAGMDKIVVLKDGAIVEEGGYAELLRRDGPFATMARKQGIIA